MKCLRFTTYLEIISPFFRKSLKILWPQLLFFLKVFITIITFVPSHFVRITLHSVIIVKKITLWQVLIFVMIVKNNHLVASFDFCNNCEKKITLLQVLISVIIVKKNHLVASFDFCNNCEK